jgi:hypothetical protein
MSNNSAGQLDHVVKEVVVKEDGRKLIYYRFQHGKAEVGQAGDIARKLQNTVSPPVAPLTSQNK